jgi:hypothetical protein
MNNSLQNDLTSRPFASLYHQTETTGIMKTIQTIITDFAAILGLNTIKETPQLIAVTQEKFCQSKYGLLL